MPFAVQERGFSMSPACLMRSLFDLTGRTALVTGAAGHLGSALADALAQAGATVVAASREQSRAQAFADLLARQWGGRHFGVALDQLDEVSLNRGFDAALACTGRLDVLVNNAIEGTAKDLTNISSAEFDRHLRNNTAYFLLARAFRDHVLGRAGQGSVIMLGSLYGMVGSYPQVYQGIFPASSVAYHALKGGTLQMVRHLAVYWARDGVRVNALSPGSFPNQQKIPAEMVRRIEERCPMGRVGHPDELKGALLFLASDASSYVTGHNLVVDGGFTAW